MSNDPESRVFSADFHGSRCVEIGVSASQTSPVDPKRYLRRTGFKIKMLSAAVGIAVLVAGASASGAFGATVTPQSKTGSHAKTTSPHRGGSVTDLLSSAYNFNWTTLDPATDSSCCDYSPKDAIFGELFEVEESSTGRAIVVPDLATGYSFENHNKTIVIDLRKGVKFSDGTTFDAAAVAYNWTRDLKTTCSCTTKFLQSAPPVIKVLSPYIVSIALDYPDATFINALQGGQFNYIGSPKAEKAMGELAFAQKPVGAGPFVVLSNTPGSLLVLKRNPHYWQKGLPYLDKLSFRVVASDEGALEAMNAGAGQAYEQMSTPSLVPSFKRHYQVTTEPTDTEIGIQFNTRVAPFNNIRAREAVLYATNAALINKKLFNDATPLTESFIEKGGLFFKSATIPGYIHYDPAKAKALVKSLGGLSFTIMTQNQNNLVEVETVLQSEWDQAGMHVNVTAADFATILSMYESEKWQATVHSLGSLDPALSIGPNLMFGPSDGGELSGVEDPTLNSILVKASEIVSPAARTRLYYQAAQIIAKKAYGTFMFPAYASNIASKGVGAPGLNTVIPATTASPAILWQYAYNNN